MKNKLSGAQYHVGYVAQKQNAKWWQLQKQEEETA